jgi:hypothetical protein
MFRTLLFDAGNVGEDSVRLVDTESVEQYMPCLRRETGGSRPVEPYHFVDGVAVGTAIGTMLQVLGEFTTTLGIRIVTEMLTDVVDHILAGAELAVHAVTHRCAR